MLTPTAQEKLVGDVLRLSCEAVTLGEFGARVLPLLEQSFDTSASLLYRCNDRGEALPVGGTLVDASYEYYSEYYSQDPAQGALRRSNVSILRPSHLAEWKAYLKSPTYLEFQRPRQVHYFVHLRLLKERHQEPGMVGIVLARSPRQADFNGRDETILTRLLPAFSAVARRSERWEEQLKMQSCVEALLQRGSRPQMAFDLQGSLLWVSERAEVLLGTAFGKTKAPENLAEAIGRLGGLVGRKPVMAVPPASVLIRRKDATALPADLRLARGRSGAYFILADLEDPGISPQVQETAYRFGLTEAETGILSLLSLGFSDREIGRRLFISRPTVRTHVGRILDKLGVASRVQAALLAHGHQLNSGTEPANE